MPPFSTLVLWLTATASCSLAATGGSFADGGNTLVSAMMVCTLLFVLYYLKVHYQMFLGNEDKLYILDKAEGNAFQIAGHPAWASVW